MTVLVTGGSKCGKSHFAESLFNNFSGEKMYIATMQPYGEEAFAAIERHRKMRSGKGFETIEKYTDIGRANVPENCGVLLECMGNLCANEMFCGEEITYPADKIIDGIKQFRSRTKLLVIVTNEVGSDGISYAEGTAEYIRAMGEINRRTAELSDLVVECVYGVPVPLKGTIK